MLYSMHSLCACIIRLFCPKAGCLIDGVLSGRMMILQGEVSSSLSTKHIVLYQYTTLLSNQLL